MGRTARSTYNVSMGYPPEPLTPSAERVLKAIREVEVATDENVFRAVRPMSREGFERAIDELVAHGLVNDMGRS